MLHNQFLIWMAGKILAYCDLDLVKTEYYKEKLDFQRKNRETHINKDNLAKSKY